MKYILLMSFFLYGCTHVQSPKDFNMQDVGKRENIVQTISADEIENIITHHEYTVLYFYTTWCGPCLQTLQTEIKNALDTLQADRLAIVLIGAAGNPGQIKSLTEKYQLNYTTYYLDGSNGMALFDKTQINKTLKQVFSKIETMNYVPICLLCDKNKTIINKSGFSSTLNTYYQSCLQ